jgi:hypothetical protein
VSPLPAKKLQNARDYNFRIVADLFYRPECKGGAVHLSFMTLSAGPRKPKHGVHITLDTPPSASLHEHEPRNHAAHLRVGALVLLQKPIIVDDVPHGYTPTVQAALEHIHLLADSRPSPTRQVTRPPGWQTCKQPACNLSPKHHSMHKTHTLHTRHTHNKQANIGEPHQHGPWGSAACMSTCYIRSLKLARQRQQLQC